MVKHPLVNEGDTGDRCSIPGSRRSPGGGNCNPLQNSCLADSMDRGACLAAVHRVASWIRLSTHTHTVILMQKFSNCFLAYVKFLFVWFSGRAVGNNIL